MYEEFTQNRIAQLRAQKNVSARDMSLIAGSEQQLHQPDRERESPAVAARSVLYL